MKKVVIDENIQYLHGVLEPWFDVVYEKGITIGPESVKDASALIVRTRTRCDGSLLSGSSVEFIATATIGFDHIDTAYCDDHGISYTNAAGSNARGVMEYVASALVHLSRMDGWKPEDKTVGIVGVGNVGSLVKWLCESLGFTVVCCDPPKQTENPSLGYLPLGELLKQADIVTCHVPLNRIGEYRTIGMVDSFFLSHLKPGAVFINSSRGEIVDEYALHERILSGRLSRTIIDVWQNEPNIDPELRDMVTLATPHIAGYSLQGKANASAMSVQALGRYFGLPLTHWYPPEAPQQVTDKAVTWEYLIKTIDDYFDISRQTDIFRSGKVGFEDFRNNYACHLEYF